MEYMILGLLILSSRTIYQLRKRIDNGLELMYSSSTGSIQTALKKLMSNGYITSSDKEENGRGRRIYSITDEGRRYFGSWVNRPIGSIDLRCPELTKLYFLGLGDKENRRSVLESYISSTDEQLAALGMICAEAEEMLKGALSQEARDVIYYQYASARFGRDLLEFTAEWYKRFIKETEEQL